VSHCSRKRAYNQSRTRKIVAAARATALACGCALPLFAGGDLFVPAGGQVSVNGGAILLACTGISSSGTMNVGAGSLRSVGDLAIQPGGIVNGGTGSIEVNQNWTNDGTFVAGFGTVDFREACGGAPAAISGNTTFSTASFQTTIGRDYFFAAGSTQTITSLLQISGTATNPIQFRSSTPAQVAYIDLLGAGAQQIQDVGVTDVWADGQPLAPTQANQGGGGNALGWFGAALAAAVNAIPTLGNAALAALATLLALAVALQERRRRASPGKSGATRASR
jgi:hypothetical protein